MTIIKNMFSFALASMLVGTSGNGTHGQWTAEQATAWQSHQPWVVGCNFIPSSAINQLEMWQQDSWDPKTIDRELGYAESIGMNSVRVYLHDLAWETDKSGFKKRLGELLTIADHHKIRPLLVFFDDCWNPDPKVGPQPAPKPGVHNSGWVRSPSDSQRNWPQDFGRLESYVTDILRTFRDDKRIWMWDLYNEPCNSDYGIKSQELVKKSFEWAWKVRPSQPLTCGAWTQNSETDDLLIQLSDVVSFHNYGDAVNLRNHIKNLEKHGRPVVCTEWMARSAGSLVETNLPVFHQEGVACFNWGLVSGKTNTIYPWDSTGGGPEPTPWFHDLFRPDGTPYDKKETDLFLRLTAR